VEQVSPAYTTARLEAGAGPLSLDVFGYGFRRGAVVLFAGTPVVTTYCETDAYCLNTHLFAKVPAELLRQAGFAKVEVQNPEPSLGSLSEAYLRIDGLEPIITSVQPGSATLTNSPFDFDMIVMVTGMNFGPDTQARAYMTGSTTIPNFDGGSVEVLSSTQLFVRISMNHDKDSLGEWQLQVANLPPGGGMSEVVSFMITEASFIPAPFLLSLSPEAVAAGGSAFRLTVNGFNLKAGSTVYFNSVPLVTTVVNDRQVYVDVPAFLIRSAGRAPVFVVNPDVGGASNRMYVEIR
jgi:hypothetical protein